MKKLISLVITLSLVITMLASVTVFAAVPADAVASEETIKFGRIAGVKFKKAGTTEAYGTATVTADGADVEVVTDATGNALRKFKIEGEKTAIPDNVGYTVFECTLNTPYTTNSNTDDAAALVNTNLTRIELYLQNFGAKSSVRAMIDGTGAWKPNEDNKVHAVVAWNEGEIYTYVNGYMKQVIEAPLSKAMPAGARKIDIQTTFGTATGITVEYPLYTISDYSIKHYLSFDPSWLDLSVVKYSYGYVEDDKPGYKYTIKTAMRGYRTSNETLSNKNNNWNSTDRLFFAIYDEEGRVTGCHGNVPVYNSGAARTCNLTKPEATGAHKLFFFRDGLYPLVTTKFINALPME